MSKYYVEYGALQANGKRLIECETSALDAKKITEDFAREIADALNGREAWKQEKAEIEADALSVGGIVEAARHKPVGNAAAMREALTNLTRYGESDIRQLEQLAKRAIDNDIYGGGILQSLCAAIREGKEALSAPARNCDLARDWLQDLYCKFKPPATVRREMPPEWVDAVMAFCKWLLAPAAERKGPGK